MSTILVVEQDVGHADQIAEALRADGFQVEIAVSIDAALLFAAKTAPRLVFASATLPHVKDLLGGFSRRRGGPGAVVVVPINLADEVSAGDFQADELLTKPFSEEHLRSLVKRCLNEDVDGAPEQPSSPTLPASIEGEQQLTSADIFGDLLAEVEADVRKSTRSAAQRSSGEDLERKLEETLSGVLDLSSSARQRKTDPPRSASSAAPSPPPGPRSSRPSSRSASRFASEVDDLLDKTLASLELPLHQRTRTEQTVTTPARVEHDEPLKDSSSLPPGSTPDAVASTTSLAEVAENILPSDDKPEELVLEPPDLEPLPEVTASASAAGFEDEGGYMEDWGSSSASLPSATSLDEPAPAEAVPEPPWTASPPTSQEEPAFVRWPEQQPELDLDSDHFRTQRLPTFLDAETGSPAGIPFGDYTLLNRVAVGGMAEVWQARRRGVEGFQKTVAIKKILSHLTDSTDFVTMFIDEAKLAAQLNHNNIIQIYDLGKVGPDYFIAMEYVDGKDLRSILRAGRDTSRPLPVGLALMIAARLARALDYAHRKRDFDNRALGLVHRDVSPQNVLISHEGEIKLCDFGIVKAVVKASTTQMGALKGKLQYMSPEQAWGKAVDSRSDIFSLGAVLFEMLTGRKLFTADTEVAVLDAVRDCRISPPSEHHAAIAPEIDDLVLRTLAKEPEERFQTAGEMEQAIEIILHEIQPRPSEAELTIYTKQLFAAEIPPAAASDSSFGALQPRTSRTKTPSSPSVSSATGARVSTPGDEEAGSRASWVVASENDLQGTDTGNGDTGKSDTGKNDTVDDPMTAAAVDDAPEETSYAPATPKRGTLLKIAVAALVVVIIAILLILALRQNQQAPSTEAVSPATALPAPAVVQPDSTEPAGVSSGETEAAETSAATGVSAASPTDATITTSTVSEQGAVSDDGPVSKDDTATSVPADLEQIVDQALSKRAEQIIQDLEAQKRRLQQELEKTRSPPSAQAETPAPATEDSQAPEQQPAPPPPPSEPGGQQEAMPPS